MRRLRGALADTKTLKRLRFDGDIDQADVAAHLGVSKTTYNFIENRRRVATPAERKKIAEFFGVNEDAIFPNPVDRVRVIDRVSEVPA